MTGEADNWLLSTKLAALLARFGQRVIGHVGRVHGGIRALEHDVDLVVEDDPARLLRIAPDGTISGSPSAGHSEDQSASSETPL